MMDKLKEDLLKALECPVCFQMMIPPITLCSNGHNICNSCKPTLQNCPTCRGNFINARNKAIEDLSRSIEHPCKFKKSGCTRTFLVGPKERHEDVCRYGPHKCPFYIVASIKCQWEGAIVNMKKHIEATHRGR